jgi:hypothetical protein
MDHDELMRLLIKIKQQHGQPLVLPQTKTELERFGASRLARSLEVAPDEPPEETIMVCIPIAPGEMLKLPDNSVSPCDWMCGRNVQYRGWVPAGIKKVCLYCAAERGANDQ